MPDLSLERAAGAPDLLVAGVDEVGRGPLAGPVVACAVVLPLAGLPDAMAALIDDSKRVRPEVRETLMPVLMDLCHVGIGWASVEEIDTHNILQASYLAMCRALSALPHPPHSALVDGNRLPPDLPCGGRAVIGGDGISLSIAAASIVAKVTRDREMARLSLEHPGYGWERNAGYATPEHRSALQALGCTPHHRRSFAPVAEQYALTL